MIRQDFQRIDPKRRSNLDHKKTQFAVPIFKQQDYPHRLNFYEIPPTAEITLEQFEQWAIDRLKSMWFDHFRHGVRVETYWTEQFWPKSRPALIETSPPPKLRHTSHHCCRNSFPFPRTRPRPSEPPTRDSKMSARRITIHISSFDWHSPPRKSSDDGSRGRKPCSSGSVSSKMTRKRSGLSSKA